MWLLKGMHLIVTGRNAQRNIVWGGKKSSGWDHSLTVNTHSDLNSASSIEREEILLWAFTLYRWNQATCDAVGWFSYFMIYSAELSKGGGGGGVWWWWRRTSWSDVEIIIAFFSTWGYFCLVMRETALERLLETSPCTSESYISSASVCLSGLSLCSKRMDAQNCALSSSQLRKIAGLENKASTEMMEWWISSQKYYCAAEMHRLRSGNKFNIHPSVVYHLQTVRARVNISS